MNGQGRSQSRALLAVPLAWLLVVFALAGPYALSPHAETPAAAGRGHAQSAPATGMQKPDDDTHGKPGVLGLPPKIHLTVNRAGTGAAPMAPVLVALPIPVDHTDAGIRIAATRAGIPPADTLPKNSLWGRAPPRTFA